MNGVPEGTTIYFAGFELNPVARSLKHEGRVVPLGPKTFDLLVYLALHPNQVVTKDELLTALWPSSFVEEGNLSQHVFLLRKALGLVSADQPIVVTIPGKGYQFAAMVEQQCGQLAGREELVIHAVETITRVVVEEEVDDDSPARLERAGARRNRKWLWRLAAGGAGLLLAAGGSLGWRWSHPDRAGHIDMVLSQIENETGDSDFDVTLNEALRIDLEQSPYLNLLSRSRIRETLAKMQRQKSEPLTASLAREICERNNAQVVLRGAISMVGKRYVFLLNAESCVSNKSIAGARAEADRKEDVLAALDRAASQIRRRLGESVASLDKFQVPIAAVSTPSLEALRAYSEGDRNSNQGNLKTAALLYENAVALDPEFASAYKSLSWVYYKEGEFSRAAGFSRKAFELRERTSERERLNIESTYDYLGLGDLEATARSLKLYLDIYPDGAANWANLCDVYTELGQYSLAIGAGEKAWQIDPNSAFAADALARAYERANRFADARRVARAAPVESSNWGTHGTLFQLAVAENDAAGVKTEEEWGFAHQSARLSLNDMGFSAAASGRLREAIQDFTRARAEALRNGNAEYAGQVMRNLASVEIDVEEPAKAGATLDAVKGDVEGLNVGGGTLGEIAFLRGELGDLAAAKRFVAAAGDGSKATDTILLCCRLPLLQALIALRTQKAANAAALLEAARPYQLRDFRVPYLRAEAEAEAGLLAAAADDYRLILNNRGVDPISPVYSLAHLRLARVLALDKKTEEARAEYRAFLGAWKDADPDLKILRDSRRELADLH